MARKELASFIEITDVSFIKQGNLELALQWWAEHKETYPLLYVTAMSVFGAFPVSAEAERQFSTAGKDMTASRSGMSPVLLRMLTLLRLNIDTVNEATKGARLRGHRATVWRRSRQDPRCDRGAFPAAA